MTKHSFNKENDASLTIVLSQDVIGSWLEPEGGKDEYALLRERASGVSENNAVKLSQ